MKILIILTILILILVSLNIPVKAHVREEIIYTGGIDTRFEIKKPKWNTLKKEKWNEIL